MKKTICFCVGCGEISPPYTDVGLSVDKCGLCDRVTVVSLGQAVDILMDMREVGSLSPYLRVSADEENLSELDFN